MEPKNPKIFISYAWEDKEKVELIYQKLSREGFDLWKDSYNLVAGEKWQKTISKEIENSDFFLACLSSNSVYEKGYVQYEFKTALEVAKLYPFKFIFILPVRLDDCEIPEDFKNLNVTDLYNADGIFLSHNMERLCEHIHLELEKRRSNQIRPIRKKSTNEVNGNHILKFINREYEKREIINPGGNKLLVINAPLGYGKTRLLNEVKEWYQKGNAPDWYCVLINLDNSEYKKAPSGIINEISAQIFKTSDDIENPVDLIVQLIGQKRNFLVLFDNAETNFEVVSYLQKEFINPLNQALNKTKIMGRFVFAGRYLRRPDWDWTGYKFLNLSVLDENIVKNAIFTESERYNLHPSVTTVVSQEITSLSVGHPGIIDKIIRSYPPGRWALYIQHNSLAFDEKVKIFEMYVMPTVDTILNEFQDEIHKKILCILSIFRKFNLNHIMALKLLAEGIAVSKNNPTQVNELLKQANTQDFLEPFKKLRQDPISLLTQLVKTGLVSGPTLEKPYFHDDIIRKLLILKMELDKENKTHYKLTQMAITIYDTWIEGKNLNGEWLPIPPSDMIQIEYIIESFYHFLKSINYQKPQNSMPMISDKIDWYIRKLRWGLFPKDWMQSTLYNTLQMDEEIPKLLNDLVGETEKNDVLKRFKFDLL